MIFALQHQAITWTNVDESPARSGGIHQWAISQDTYPSLSYIILSYSILSYPLLSYPILSYGFQNYYSEITAESPRGQWLIR